MKMLINGASVDASDGKRIEITNPATGAVVDTVPAATKDDCEAVLDAAVRAKDAWASTPIHQRVDVMLKFADALDAHAEEIAKIQCLEQGKLIGDCRVEMETTARLFRGYARRASHLYGNVFPDNHPGAENDLIFTRREPLGVVVCIVPFNFPAELFAHKVAPALAMGNVVIVKPSIDNPLHTIRLVELLRESGAPDGVCQVVTGKGSVIGPNLLHTRKIDAISFTGSTEVGQQLVRDSAEYLHRVFMELGGNDAMIVFDDVDIDYAVEQAIQGRAANAGQVCCSTKRFIVHNRIREQFTKKLCERLSQFKMGDPMDPATTMPCLINEQAAIEVEKQIAHTVSQGATLAMGGKRVNRTFIEPTVLSNVTAEMDIAVDMEVFGPVFPIIGFDTAEQAVAIANATRYGLNGGVVTNDPYKAFAVARKMQCGIVNLNGTGNYRTIDTAFGGYKMSGLGREGVSHTLEEMSQVKTYAIPNFMNPANLQK